MDETIQPSPLQARIVLQLKLKTSLYVLNQIWHDKVSKLSQTTKVSQDQKWILLVSSNKYLLNRGHRNR